jgi:hypothetical protein
MMPISTIARKARSIEAQHGTDLSSAKSSNQAVEAGPFCGAARRATKIVVDHFNVGEATLTRNFDKLLLALLALQVRLDLLRRGLTDIDHGFALQNVCRK